MKATIHWVSAADSIAAEVRLYNPLFTQPDPSGGEDFAADLNPNSLEVLTGARLEPALAERQARSAGAVRAPGLFLPRHGRSAGQAGVQPHRRPARHLGEREGGGLGSPRQTVAERKRKGFGPTNRSQTGPVQFNLSLIIFTACVRFFAARLNPTLMHNLVLYPKADMPALMRPENAGALGEVAMISPLLLRLGADQPAAPKPVAIASVRQRASPS